VIYDLAADYYQRQDLCLAEKSAAEAADFALSTNRRAQAIEAYELAGLSAEEQCYTRPPDYFDITPARSPMTVVSLTHWSSTITLRRWYAR